MSEIITPLSINLVLTTQNRSTQLIYLILQERRMKISDIRQKTNYSERTIRTSLQILLDLQLIQRYPDLYDVRSNKYQITKQHIINNK